MSFDGVVGGADGDVMSDGPGAQAEAAIKELAPQCSVFVSCVPAHSLYKSERSLFNYRDGAREKFRKLRIFSERVRWKMSERGLQSNELASVLGVEPSSVSNWMTGRNRAKGKNLRDLAKELNCSVSYLKGEESAEPAGLRESPPQSETELWKRRANVAEKKLNDLRAALRSLIDLSSDSPQAGGSELVSMLRAAGVQAEAELQPTPPTPGAGAPNGPGPSPSGVASPGSNAGTPREP